MWDHTPAASTPVGCSVRTRERAQNVTGGACLQQRAFDHIALITAVVRSAGGSAVFECGNGLELISHHLYVSVSDVVRHLCTCVHVSGVFLSAMCTQLLLFLFGKIRLCRCVCVCWLGCVCRCVVQAYSRAFVCFHLFSCASAGDAMVAHVNTKASGSIVDNDTILVLFMTRAYLSHIRLARASYNVGFICES